MAYYSEKLAGLQLKKCYDLATPRIVQYLNAEIEFVRSRIRPQYSVLELGCGYGRVIEKIANSAKQVTGIDSANENIKLAKSLFSDFKNCTFLLMNATEMTFADNSFDMVFCIQNGICAFNVNYETLVSEAIRVTRPGGKTIFSSYLDKIWHERLKWFEIQSYHGLVGEIDYQKIGNGIIVCKDGFKSDTMRQNDFEELGSKIKISSEITEIDQSSLFCKFVKPETK